jgi:hypothetical protein
MVATLTIQIESTSMQGMPVPGQPVRSIPELLELIAMRIEKEPSGSMRIIELTVRER